MSWPSPASRSLTAGSASASMAAALNFAIASFGVPFGIHMPNQAIT